MFGPLVSQIIIHLCDILFGLAVVAIVVDTVSILKDLFSSD